jgi:hypothetical protein
VQASQSVLGPLAASLGAALTAHDFSLPALVQALGGEFVSPHLDADRIAAVFGSSPATAPLLATARRGIIPPVADAPTDHAARLAQGNLASAEAFPHAIWERAAGDLADGRAILLPRDVALRLPHLRISPVGAIERTNEDGTKVRVIHHLSWAGTLADGSPDFSVNDLTDPSRVPPCPIGGVFAAILARVYALRLRHPKAHIVLSKVDVADAFRQLPIHPAFAGFFAYSIGGYIMVELRLGFGWAASPGLFYQWATAMIERLRSLKPSDVSEEMVACAQELLERLGVEEAPPQPIAPVPPDESALASLPEGLGIGDDEFFGEAFLDDTIGVEINDGVRPRLCSAALIWLHYALYGPPRPGAPPCLRLKKLTGWSSTLDVLGVVINANDLTVSLTPFKAERLRQLLHDDFPRSRERAQVRELLQLVGWLRCYSYCVRPGRYFLWRLLDPVRGHYHSLRRLVVLTPAFHADLDAWRQITSTPALLANRFATPLFKHVRRDPEALAVSDACFVAGGGIVAPEGLWWQVVWPEELHRRAEATHARAAHPDIQVTIAQLELAALILGVATWTAAARERGEEVTGQAMLALADSMNAVFWVRKCGARDRRAAALMRLLGVEEVTQRFSLLANHVPGVDNEVADFISRHHADLVPQYMASIPCPLTGAPVSWRQVAPPASWLERVLSVLLHSTPITL